MMIEQHRSYVTKEHTVTKVEKSACQAAIKELSNDDSGLTTVTLDISGDHFFICTVDNHCASGMKLSVTVAAPSTGGRLLPPAMNSIIAAVVGALIKLALL
nr:unnamed protein product [Digitaria exilis]